MRAPFSRLLCLVLILGLALALPGCAIREILEDFGPGSSDVVLGTASPRVTAAATKDPDAVILREPDSGRRFTVLGLPVVWIGADSYGVAVCGEEDFCTLLSTPFTTRYAAGDGLYLYTKQENSIPYILISRAEKGGSQDPKAYLEERYLPQMKEQYGDNFLRAGAVEAWSVGGKSLYRVEVAYRHPEYPEITITATRACCVYEGAFLFFTAKSRSDEPDTLQASLEEAVRFFRTGAKYDPEQWQDAWMEDKPKTGGFPTLPPALPSPEASDFGAYSLSPAPSLNLATTIFENEIFSMEVPVGWTLTTRGAYTDFGLYLYDPQVPERKIFFYCKAMYFNKSQAAKDWYARMAALVDPAADLQGWHTSAAVPVLDPATTGQFFTVYEDLVRVIYQVDGYGHVFPDLHGVSVLESHPGSAPVTPGCLDASIVRIAFTADSGTACEGLMSAEVTDVLSLWEGGVDIGLRGAYDVMGISAPEGEFRELEATLLRCLASFDFKQSYVEKSVQATREETERILAQNRDRQAVYDAYNEAWSRRDQANDIAAQIRSDLNLGYERLYDPETNAVYRAESGFYDDYNAKREAFGNPRLQRIDAANEAYYLQSVDYYITK